jgi:hypothetical protein
MYLFYSLFEFFAPTKYVFTGECKTIFGKDGSVIVRRILSCRDFGNVPSGKAGGWIASGKNLSHRGTSWVADEAVVFEDAMVVQDACVCDCATVSGRAVIQGNARVFSSASIGGNAVIGIRPKIVYTILSLIHRVLPTSF